MSTFSKASVWPIGYFRAFSGWLMNNRRTIATRMSTLSAEIERIGFIKVYYRLDSSGNRTEERMGFSVTPGSTVEKLVQAYIANGGNPLEISSFMYPQNSTVAVDAEGNTTVGDQYPEGGVVAPRSADPDEPRPSETDTGYGVFPGGMAKTHRYYPARQGARVSPGSYDYDPLVKSMHQIRSWANQDIKERLNDLEARIIKQCDLREQLIKERDVTLIQAFGGVLSEVPALDSERFDKNMMPQNMISDVENLVYDNGVPRQRPDVYLPFTFDNEPADGGVELSA